LNSFPLESEHASGQHWVERSRPTTAQRAATIKLQQQSEPLSGASGPPSPKYEHHSAYFAWCSA
jgi:hypothetical protein